MSESNSHDLDEFPSTVEHPQFLTPANELSEILQALVDDEDDDDDDEKCTDPSCCPPDDNVTKNINAGDLTQWAHHAHGFVAMTKTTPKLSAGVYKFEMIGNALCFVEQQMTSDDLVLLPDTRSSDVINEITQFWTLADEFKKFGFAHKRGFLLHGPQGSGKTSTLQFVIKELVKNDGLVVLANTTAPSVVASKLQDLRKVEPTRPLVVVIEDIDAYIANYDESDVLALLDGELSVNHVVFIATTNYPEKLDGRISNRPSRFDRVVFIDVPNEEARRVYLKSRALPIPAEEIENWVKKTDGFSIAHLKEIIVSVFCYKSSFNDVFTRLKKMERLPKSESQDNAVGFGA